MKILEAKAYAKINLTLDVFPKRFDGYHPIRSVMQTISLHDDITVTLIPSEQNGFFADCPGIISEENLCVKAARRFFEDFGIGTYSVKIKIEKRIPMQAGLGGGSSDAAAVLSLLGKEFGVETSRLLPIARFVGSDVPFFLYGGTCLVEGTGEKVTQLAPFAGSEFLLVKPSAGTSAKEVYDCFDRNKENGEAKTDVFLSEPNLRNCGNMLTFASLALYAEQGRIIEKLTVLGASDVILCGSGTSVVGFFGSGDINRVKTFFEDEFFCGIYEFYDKHNTGDNKHALHGTK